MRQCDFLVDMPMGRRNPASDQIVIDTIVSKCCDHTPLYRQSAIPERDTGLELSRATLDGWVLRVGERLIPMVSAMRRELIRGRYIQADETLVDVQMHEGSGKNHQAYLWQYGRPRGTAVFDFRLGRGRDGPKQFLGQFEGLLQTDGYAAYDQIGGPKMVHAGCWSHAERYFSEAVQLNPQDPVATAIVARIDELFAIDAEARRQRLSLEARDALTSGTSGQAGCNLLGAGNSIPRRSLPNQVQRTLELAFQRDGGIPAT
jgi:transposase